MSIIQTIKETDVPNAKIVTQHYDQRKYTVLVFDEKGEQLFRVWANATNKTDAMQKHRACVDYYNQKGK
jgi:uncharacterized protein (DUF1684 family)